MNSQLVLHLGAHRTGTTSIQAALDAAAGKLSRSGIVALTPPRPGKRNITTVRKLVRILVSAKGSAAVLKVPFKRLQFRSLLNQLIRESGTEPAAISRLILSDEMILGRAFAPDGSSIYPFSLDHLTSLKRVLSQPVDEIHLTLRSYDSFLISVYAMRAVYARNTRPFGEIGGNLLKAERRWPQVVEDIMSVFSEAQLILSTVEDSGLKQRISALAGAGSKEIDFSRYLPERLNRAPTLEAIEWAVSGTNKREDPDVLVTRFENGTPFDPLSAAEKARLNTLYLEDIRKLREVEGPVWL